jgi:hypothetical protein
VASGRAHSVFAGLSFFLEAGDFVGELTAE